VAHFSGHFFALSGKLPINLPLSVYAHQKLKKIHAYFADLQAEYQAFYHKKTTEATIIPALKKTLNQQLSTDKTGTIKEVLAQIDRYRNQMVAPFPDFHLIRSPQLSPAYTDGKQTTTFSELDSVKHEYYYASIFEPAVNFLKKYHQKAYDFEEIEEKIKLFEKDFTYFNQFDLYFIEVKADHEKFYKIGLTSRVLSKRLKEIEQDLKKHYLNIQLKPLFQLKGFAFLETFFKHKYAKQQLKIGQLTEYFSFPKETIRFILKDLELLNFEGMPKRTDKAWIDWIYFNFTGKIYGYREKSVYIKQEKLILTTEEYDNLTDLMKNKEHL